MGCRKLNIQDCFSFVEQPETAYRVRRNSTARRPYRRFSDPAKNSLYRDFKLLDDSLNRLTKEVSECADKPELAYTDEYTYDLVGNRLKKCSSGFQPETLTYTYNANDQLTLESSSTKGDTIYSYDANGSQIGKGNETQNESYLYSYNLQNRLSTATITRMEGTSLVNITSSYVYNQAGIRVKSNTTQTLDGVATTKNRKYLLDAGMTGYQQVLEEIDATNNSLVKSYTLGDDVLAQTFTNNGLRITNYLQYDGHGSTRLLTSASSAVSARYNYDAYGIMLGGFPNVTTPNAHVTPESGVGGTDMLYSGEQFDPNLQMQYLRARYYDQNNGRFNRLDPFGGNNYDLQSLHKYGYAHSEPVMGIDPSGNELLTLGTIGIITMLIGAVLAGIGTAAKMSKLQSVGTSMFFAGFTLLIGAKLGALMGLGVAAFSVFMAIFTLFYESTTNEVEGTVSNEIKNNNLIRGAITWLIVNSNQGDGETIPRSGIIIFGGKTFERPSNLRALNDLIEDEMLKASLSDKNFSFCKKSALSKGIGANDRVISYYVHNDKATITAFLGKGTQQGNIEPIGKNLSFTPTSTDMKFVRNTRPNEALYMDLRLNGK